MKTNLLFKQITILVCVLAMAVGVQAQINEWTWIAGDKASNPAPVFGTKGVAASSNKPGARRGGKISRDNSGNIWVFGGFSLSSAGWGRNNDLWKWDGTNWTWISGTNTTGGAGVYGTKGVAASTNTPGGRGGFASWTDAAGNFWIFGGMDNSGGRLNDLWKFDVNTLMWTWVSGDNIPNQSGNYGTKGVASSTNKPGGRGVGQNWIDGSGNFWFVGGFGYAASGFGGLNDMWKWDGTNWTWVSGDNTVNNTAVMGTKGVTSSTTKPGVIRGASAASDNAGNVYIYGGSGWSDLLWKWDGTNWTWLSGTGINNQSPVYGTKGVAASTNTPGGIGGTISYTDNSGNLFLLGGWRPSATNTIWKWDGTNWTWVYGPNTAGNHGTFGTKGVSSSSNYIHAIRASNAVKDNSGNIYIGPGESDGAYGRTNTIWKYSLEDIKVDTFWTAQNGSWEDTLTWVGHKVPGANDSAVIRHRVNVTSTTGAVTVGAITMHTDLADADLDIYSGDKFTVARNLEVINMNLRDFHVDLIVRNGSELVVTGDLDMERSFGNTSAKRCRLRIVEGSKVSCDDFIFNNHKSGLEGGTEVEMNISSLTVAGDLTWNHSAQRDFNANIDSSTLSVAGQTRFVQNSGARRFNVSITGNSAYSSTGNTTCNLRGGDDMNITFSRTATCSVGGNLNEFHTGGDDFTLTVQHDAKLNVAGFIFIDQHVADHINRFRDNAVGAITGDYRVDKDGGLSTSLNLRNKAVVTVNRVNQNVNGATSTVIRAEDTSTLNVLDEYRTDILASTGNAMLRLDESAVANLSKSYTTTQSGGANQEIELNGTSKLNITGDCNITTTGGGVNMVDLNGGTMNVAGPNGVTINLANNIGTSGIFLTLGSELNVRTGNLSVTTNIPSHTYRTAAGGSKISVAGNILYTYNAGNDGIFAVNRGGSLTVGGNFSAYSNSLDDDMIITFDSADVDITGNLSMYKLSAGTTGSPDAALSFTGKTTADIGNIVIDHTRGRNCSVNFSGNIRGGSVTKIGNLTATRNSTALNLYVNTTGNVDNSGTLNVSGSIDLTDNGTNVAGNVRLLSDRDGKVYAPNINLVSNNAGNNIEIESNRNGEFHISNDLNFTAQADGDAQMDMNGTSDIYIGGAIVRNANRGNLTMQSVSTLHFNGTAPQVIPSRDPGAVGGDLFRYSNIELDNGAGFTMGAGGAEMTDTMWFTDGILTTTAANQMTFVGARAYGYMPSATSHIAGPATKRGAGDFVFPLGKDDKLGKLGISNPGNGGNFTGEYFRGIPTDHTNLEPTMQNISTLEWWELDRNSGNASTYVTLYWERADSSGIEDGPDLRVAHYTGGVWKDEWKSAITGATSGAGSGSVTTQNPISTFSPFTFGSNNALINPLPVTLTTFKAKLVEPTKALVEWETVTEINNDYFEVMRSFDGNNFESIQTVKGAGNSNAPIAYNIVDPNLGEVGAAYAFYKLKQVDFDGKTTYSKVIPLALNADGRTLSSLNAEVTPNPYNTSLNINFHNTAATATPVNLRIMDAFGRTILATEAMSEAGFTTKTINMENYAAGVYFVVVEHNGISKTIKTIKQ